MSANLLRNLFLGAYHDGTTYSSVILNSADPRQTISTGLQPIFPQNMLNTTLPTGSAFGSGTGGSTAINRVFKLTIAEPLNEDSLHQPDNSIESSAINGKGIHIAVPSAPRALTVVIANPTSQLGDAAANSEWRDMAILASRKPRIWVLHANFAGKGFISTDPGVFINAGFDVQRRITIKFDEFYLVSITGSTRQYSLIEYDT